MGGLDQEMCHLSILGPHKWGLDSSTKGDKVGMSLVTATLHPCNSSPICVHDSGF